MKSKKPNNNPNNCIAHYGIDKGDSFRQSGANLVLSLGWWVMRFSQIQSRFGSGFALEENDDISQNIRKAYEELVNFIATHQTAIICKFLVHRHTYQVNPRLCMIFSYLSARLCYLGSDKINLMELCHVCAEANPVEKSPILEYRRVIGALLLYEEEWLSSSKNELGANPAISLGRKYLQYFLGYYNMPFQDEQSVIRLKIELVKKKMAEGKKANTDSSNSSTTSTNETSDTPEIPDIMDTPVLSPKALFKNLSKTVIGQDNPIKTLSVRGHLAIQRAKLLQSGKDTTTPNEVILMIGSSGTGKTYLAEQFGALVKRPFVSISSTSCSLIGYAGGNLVDDAVRSLMRKFGGDSQEAADKGKYSVIFVDEIDKKRAASDANGLDVSGAGVQNELLRWVQGCKTKINYFRSEKDKGIEFDSTGSMFCLAGAFSGLDKIISSMEKKNAGIGFSHTAIPVHHASILYDALLEYGMLAELLNRLTAIVRFRDLDVEDLIRIATNPHAGVIPAYNALLQESGISFSLSTKAIRCMAEYCVDTKLYARGLKLLISNALEDIVFTESKGHHVLEASDIQPSMDVDTHEDVSERTMTA